MQTSQTTTPAIREISQGVWKAQSKSHPAASHTVRRSSAGILSCTCPATRKCWHIKEIEAMSKPEPTFIPVQDAPDDDPFGDMPFPAMKITPVNLPVALPEAHKPSMFELVSFWEN